MRKENSMGHLVTAHGETNHITVDDTRAFNTAFLGTANAVIDGCNITYDATNVRIDVGSMILDGRHYYNNEIETIEVNSSSSGYRKSLISFVIVENATTLVEEYRWFVSDGMIATSQADATYPTSQYEEDGYTVEAIVDVIGVTVSTSGIISIEKLIGDYVGTNALTKVNKEIKYLIEFSELVVNMLKVAYYNDDISPMDSIHLEATLALLKDLIGG